MRKANKQKRYDKYFINNHLELKNKSVNILYYPLEIKYGLYNKVCKILTKFED